MRNFTEEHTDDWETAKDLGLCVHCCSAPVNPALSDISCLSCYEEGTFTDPCDVTGCPNRVSGSIGQSELCEIHLVDAIHSRYDNYCERKTRLEREEQKLDDEFSDMDKDPRKIHVPDKELTSSQESKLTDWYAIQQDLSDLEVLAQQIKGAMRQVDQPFPEEFDASF